MTLTQLHYVITIAETGSMNKAAELLYVAQPSLTNAIKELERLSAHNDDAVVEMLQKIVPTYHPNRQMM